MLTRTSRCPRSQFPLLMFFALISIAPQIQAQQKEANEIERGVQATTQVGSDAAAPLTRHLLTLLALRDNPQLLDEDKILHIVMAQIAVEQKEWKAIDAFLAQDRKYPGRLNLNRKRPAFIYEWQKLEKDNPQFANGPILDVFVRSESSWEFVKEEPEWDDRFGAVVGVFLFERTQIEGRNPQFAAKELLPVWKRHLAATVKRLPKQLLMSTQLSEPAYDFDTENFPLVPAYKLLARSWSRQAREQVRDLPDILMPIINPSYEDTPENQRPSGGSVLLPESARGCCPYYISGYSEPEPVPQLWARIYDRSSVAWGESMTFYNNPILLLDHRLTLTSIPASPGEAEKLLERIRKGAGVSGKYPLEARMMFETIRVDTGKEFIRNKSKSAAIVLFVRLAGVDLLTLSGEVVASYSPDDFPTAEAAGAAAAAEKQAEEQRNKDAEEETAAAAQGVREKIDARFAQCAAITDPKQRAKCLDDMLQDKTELHLTYGDLARLDKMKMRIRIEQASAEQLREVQHTTTQPATQPSPVGQ